MIIAAPGTYSGTVNPFGKAITIRSVDPDDPLVVEQTVLDGGGNRVVAFFSGERLDTRLEGFTITGGAADQGGGIGILASDPVIRQCVIRENTAVMRRKGTSTTIRFRKVVMSSSGTSPVRRL